MLEDYCGELNEKDFEFLIKRKLPIEIKEKKICIGNKKFENRNYVNVAFYFDGVSEPPEVFYTHFYITEIEKYLKDK